MQMGAHLPVHYQDSSTSLCALHDSIDHQSLSARSYAVGQQQMTALLPTWQHQTVIGIAQIPVKHSTRGEQHKPVCNGGYLYWAVWEGEELQLAAM